MMHEIGSFPWRQAFFLVPLRLLAWERYWLSQSSCFEMGGREAELGTRAFSS